MTIHDTKPQSNRKAGGKEGRKGGREGGREEERKRGREEGRKRGREEERKRERTDRHAYCLHSVNVLPHVDQRTLEPRLFLLLLLLGNSQNPRWHHSMTECVFLMSFYHTCTLKIRVMGPSKLLSRCQKHAR